MPLHNFEATPFPAFLHVPICMQTTASPNAKAARTDHDVLDAISERWSPRAFDPERPVEPEKLRQVLEAARWAASSYNEQPWRFIVATTAEPDERERLLGCLKAFNQEWARRAPVLMLTVAKKHFGEEGSEESRPNRHALHDVGLAMGNLSAQATALGLYLHQMAGIEPEAAREAYDIPSDFEPVAGVALGYHGDPSVLPEQLREREEAERKRRPLAESVFTGAWGTPAGALSR